MPPEIKQGNEKPTPRLPARKGTGPQARDAPLGLLWQRQSWVCAATGLAEIQLCVGVTKNYRVFNTSPKKHTAWVLHPSAPSRRGRAGSPGQSCGSLLALLAQGGGSTAGSTGDSCPQDTRGTRGRKDSGMKRLQKSKVTQNKKKNKNKNKRKKVMPKRAKSHLQKKKGTAFFPFSFFSPFFLFIFS